MNIEPYGQRYRITWKSYDRQARFLGEGTLKVKVTKPRLVDWTDGAKVVHRSTMNIRAQAQTTADAYLRNHKPEYRKGTGHVLTIEPIA